MAEVVLFHHALGLTAGVQEFAGVLPEAGMRCIHPISSMAVPSSPAKTVSAMHKRSGSTR